MVGVHVAVEEEATEVPVEDTQMGTIVIQPATLVDSQDERTILQLIPTGIITQGLELQSKLFLYGVSLSRHLTFDWFS